MKPIILEAIDNTDNARMIQKRLPYLFQLAELECSRAGKIGMQVGSLRENIIIALLINLFGQENVDTNIPITKPEVDVIVKGEPISIKTITGTLSGVKLIWTVDAESALNFINEYRPSCDIILINIQWASTGYFFYIPKEAQIEAFNHLGKSRYLKLPKPGTNPRGVEITKEALIETVQDDRTKIIPIEWQKAETNFNIYEKWTRLWSDTPPSSDDDLTRRTLF